ncbi:MAG: hypothetical protein sL5_03540 [Candidatus Mesenet longicola]|uniref:Uncharacterized protein n=1 Tax=Candidatus Mesenet longicola TaxID=1892558 RepID=A0A8J3HPA4_9RICK|nr:MAG: hypothetical protein sGL2_07630 [Candidatus Mesenet longicola]GHM59361.1 MAG: hypothetical protein sL5_03540 [Candidatus Mesenet longicola]
MSERVIIENVIGLDLKLLPMKSAKAFSIEVQSDCFYL